MSKKDDLLNNNDNKKEETKSKQPRTKKTDDLVVLKEENQNLSFDNYDIHDNDEIVNVELYNEILSTLFNSLNNPIVRNEIKVNEDILKYLELQISNLFYLETVLSKKLAGKKMAKEFLQLTANILDLALTVNKSPKKTRIEILEDRNLLIVTIVNSCKGVERESLERLRDVDTKSLQNLSNQVVALSNFATEKTSNSSVEDDFENEDSSTLENVNNSPNPNNTLNNQSMNDLNNNMANLTKMGLLPQHPASNPKFYPYLTKPLVIPKLKKVLGGMLIFSSLMIIITMVISALVKGSLVVEEGKPAINFVLSQTNNWLILVMTIILYASFAYVFIRPSKLQREKYHMSYFMLGLLFFWLIVTISYFFWEISDNYYHNYFLALVKEGNKLNKDVVENMKNLPYFQVFKIFAIITAAVTVFPLLVVLVLILINPKLDRNKVMRANMEYQNAMSAALNGQKYEMDPSLFDSEEPQRGKRKKANFSGRF